MKNKCEWCGGSSMGWYLRKDGSVLCDDCGDINQMLTEQSGCRDEIIRRPSLGKSSRDHSSSMSSPASAVSTRPASRKSHTHCEESGKDAPNQDNQCRCKDRHEKSSSPAPGIWPRLSLLIRRSLVWWFGLKFLPNSVFSHRLDTSLVDFKPNLKPARRAD